MNDDVDNIIQLIKKLSSDVDFSIQNLNEAVNNDIEFEYYARSYIRSMASWIEGMIWVFKKTIASSKYQKQKNISLESQLYLIEHDWRLSHSGKPKLQSKKIKTKENIKGLFYVVHEIFGGEEINYTGQGWEGVLHFYKVRDRMMHPSDLQCLSIKKEDIKQCECGREWLKEKFKNISYVIEKDIFKS